MTLNRIFVTVLAVALAIGGAVAAKEIDDAEKKKEEGLTLETPRRLDFTVDRATWLSVDVAPDGRTLLLAVLGDLYTVPVEGGAATRITAGPGFDSQPRYSPDGSKIAFVSDRDGSENVWIAGADGQHPKKLSADDRADFASPTWTPDGEYVVASRAGWGFGTYELWMYHVKGGSGVQITKARPEGGDDGPGHNALGAVFSGDGRYLYYARRSGGFAYNARFPLWQVARRDLRTGDEDVLTNRQGSGIRPAISADGRLLVYATRFDTRTGLRVRNLETGEDRWLKYPVQRDEQESRFTRDLLPGYALLPGDEALVVTWDGGLHRVELADGSSTPIPFSVDVDLEIGARLHFPQAVETGPVEARLIQDPALSPDGNRVAFSALTRLYVAGLDEERPSPLTAAGIRAYQPAWSPDGRRLAYVSWAAGEGHLWTIEADGSEAPRQVTRVPAFYSDPVWSPDGRRIVVLRGSAHDRVREDTTAGASGRDLVWFPAEGGDATLILPARGLGKPHFGEDPERVYVYLSPGLFAPGDSGLVSLRWDGSDRRTHLKVTAPGLYFTAEPVPAYDIRVSPDGRWALAQASTQLYLLALPRVGGEPPTVNVDSPTVPLKKLTRIGADYFGWSADGATVTWAVGSTFFRQPVASVEFESEEEEEGENEEKKRDGKKKKKKVEDEKKPEPVHWVSQRYVIEAERDTPRGVLVLRGARAVTMRGDEIIGDADIVVRDNRIEAIGPRGTVALPAGATIRDLAGMTVLPGFVDTHAHWFEHRRGVLDTENWSFLANVAYGVTAGLDVQTSTNDMFAYQDLVDAGEIVGPRAWSTGPGIFSDNAFEDLEQAKAVLGRYRDHYRTRNLKAYIVGNRKTRQLVAQAARELEMMPTTEGALDLKLDLTHALDGFAGNEHNLPVVPLFDDVVELYARSKIGYTPTLLVTYGGPWAENWFYTEGPDIHDDPKLNRFLPHELIDAKSRRRPWVREDEYVFTEVAEQAAKIVRAGGLVGVGSHGQLQGLGYHWELWALAGGMTPHEALRCATVLGAEIIGRSGDIGSLEAGKLADLVIVAGDPLSDIRDTLTIRWVMKNGELYDADTLDRVWPDEQPLAPLWWWDEPVSGLEAVPEAPTPG